MFDYRRFMWTEPATKAYMFPVVRLNVMDLEMAITSALERWCMPCFTRLNTELRSVMAHAAATATASAEAVATPSLSTSGQGAGPRLTDWRCRYCLRTSSARQSAHPHPSIASSRFLSPSSSSPSRAFTLTPGVAASPPPPNNFEVKRQMSALSEPLYYHPFEMPKCRTSPERLLTRFQDAASGLLGYN